MGRKIINTENVTDADVFDLGEDLRPYRNGRAEERTVVITNTATETAEDGTFGAHRIWLEGEDADLFLESLPVYTPGLEGS